MLRGVVWAREMWTGRVGNFFFFASECDVMDLRILCFTFLLSLGLDQGVWEGSGRFRLLVGDRAR